MPFLTIAFPVFDPIAISIGPIAIRWYALAYIGGIVHQAADLVEKPIAGLGHLGRSASLWVATPTQWQSWRHGSRPEWSRQSPDPKP